MKRTIVAALAATLTLTACTPVQVDSEHTDRPLAVSPTGPSMPPEPSAGTRRAYFIVIREIGVGLAKDEAEAVAKGRRVCAVIGAHPDDTARQLKAVDETFGILAPETAKRVLIATHGNLCKDWRMRTP